jgi:hypothetical protein
MLEIRTLGQFELHLNGAWDPSTVQIISAP